MSLMPCTAIIVCVEYDDILALTLPRTTNVVENVVVMTSLTDGRTVELCSKYRNVQCVRTDAFYRGGARFNKGLAVEEAFALLDYSGWLLVMDADIVLPRDAPRWDCLDWMIGRLYTPVRRVLSDIRAYTENYRWDRLPIKRSDFDGHYGYFQLFSGEDPVLQTRPWYGTRFCHAGGCDDAFQRRWAIRDKLRPPFEVLHLGECDQNWFGRTTPRLDGHPIGDVRDRADSMRRMMRDRSWTQTTPPGSVVR